MNRQVACEKILNRWPFINLGKQLKTFLFGPMVVLVQFGENLSDNGYTIVFVTNIWLAYHPRH